MPSPDSGSDLFQNPQICRTCRQLGLALQSYQDAAKHGNRMKPIHRMQDTSLGSFQEVMKRTTCPTCCLIVQRAMDRKCSWTQNSKLELRVGLWDDFYIQNDGPPYSA